jgi:E-phenylitaconyl-CoA hydratase
MSDSIVRKVGADGEIWTLTIDRPEVRNAMDVEAMIELNELSRAFEEDPRARVLIITGRGDKAFCAGADLRVTPGDGPAFLRSWLRDPRSDAGSYARLLSIDLVVPTKPTIAAINGFAVGGGFELALACDLRIIDETAKVGLPEVLRGSIPAAGAIHRLVRIAGYATAADLALTGRLVAASEAMSLGLANEIAPPGTAVAAAEALASHLCAGAPIAVGAIKRLLSASTELDRTRYLDFEQLMWGHVANTRDRAEGREAFREGRAPDFTGE